MARPNEEIRHLLARTGFGVSRPEEIAASSGRPHGETVERLLDSVSAKHYTPAPAWVAQGLLRPAEQYISKSAQTAMQKERRDEGRDLKGWWYAEMLSTPAPFTEHLVLFWHNHFTSQLQKVSRAELMYKQTALFRQYATGNFAKLLRATAKDPAMLIYLDTNSNRALAPNENYARELMELFTLGEGRGYTEKDIREAARAFTGWRVQIPGTGFKLDGTQHDAGMKTFMGRQGRFDGDDVIEIILEQPQVAEFITEKLWLEFVNDEPDADEIKRLAKIFRDSKYEMRPLLVALFNSPTFRDPQNRGSLVKSPTDLMVGTFRLIGGPPQEAAAMVPVGRTLGQEILDPPNVKGWPGGLAWIDTALLPARSAFMQGIAAGVDVVVNNNQKLLSQANRDMRGIRPSAMDINRLKALNALPADELAAVTLAVPPATKVNAPGGALGALLVDPTYNLK